MLVWGLFARWIRAMGLVIRSLPPSVCSLALGGRLVVV
jgi:hypothetical protein